MRQLQIVRCGRAEVGEKEMDPLLRGRDGDHLLRRHVRVRSSVARRRDNGMMMQIFY